MNTLLLYNSQGHLHLPGRDHPESPERLTAILQALEALPVGCELMASNRLATLSDLLRVHNDKYIKNVLALQGQYADLDYETKLSPNSVVAALQAAGTCLELIDSLLDRRTSNGFAIVRPPGHHAERSRGMGYCIFNNIAIAAAYALNRGLSRVLILDWDVHHGNGTQEIFYRSSDVLVCSLHQDRLFPNAGTMEEVGVESGAGFNINVPFPPGATDSDYAFVTARILNLIGGWFRPELILVSCGFDAHIADPMGNMKLSSYGFAELTRLGMELADCFACGRIGLILEGGYAIGVLGECVLACTEMLSGVNSSISTRIPQPMSSQIAERSCEILTGQRWRFPYA